MFARYLGFGLLFCLVRLRLCAIPEVDRRYIAYSSGRVDIVLSAIDYTVELLNYSIASYQITNCKAAPGIGKLILGNGSMHTVVCDYISSDDTIIANVTLLLRDSANASNGDNNRLYSDTFKRTSVLKLDAIPNVTAEVFGSNVTIRFNQDIVWTATVTVTVKCHVTFPDDTKCGVSPNSTRIVKSVPYENKSLLLPNLLAAHKYDCSMTRRYSSSIYDSDPKQFQLTTSDSVSSANQNVLSMPYREESSEVDYRNVTLYWTNPPECATNGAIRPASIVVFPLAPNGSRLAPEPYIGSVRHSEAELRLRYVAYDIELRVNTSRGVNEALPPTRVRVSPRPVTLECNMQQAQVQVGSKVVSWRWPCRVRTPQAGLVLHARFCNDESVCKQFSSEQHDTWESKPLKLLLSELNITRFDQLIVMLGVSQPMEATGLRRVPCFYVEYSKVNTDVDFITSDNSVTALVNLTSCKSAMTSSVDYLILIAAPHNCAVRCGESTPSCALLVNKTVNYTHLHHSLTVQPLASNTRYDMLLCAVLRKDGRPNTVHISSQQLTTDRYNWFEDYKIAIISTTLCLLFLLLLFVYVRYRRTQLSKVIRADEISQPHVPDPSGTTTRIESEPGNFGIGTLDLRDCGLFMDGETTAQ